jgi:hypothetical protein
MHIIVSPNTINMSINSSLNIKELIYIDKSIEVFKLDDSNSVHNILIYELISRYLNINWLHGKDLYGTYLIIIKHNCIDQFDINHVYTIFTNNFYLSLTAVKVIKEIDSIVANFSIDIDINPTEYFKNLLKPIYQNSKYIFYILDKYLNKLNNIDIKIAKDYYIAIYNIYTDYYILNQKYDDAAVVLTKIVGITDKNTQNRYIIKKMLVFLLWGKEKSYIEKYIEQYNNTYAETFCRKFINVHFDRLKSEYGDLIKELDEKYKLEYSEINMLLTIKSF